MNDEFVLEVLSNCKQLAIRLEYAGEFINLSEEDFLLLKGFYQIVGGQYPYPYDEILNHAEQVELEESQYPFTGCVKAPNYCKIKPWKSLKHLKFKSKYSNPGLKKPRNISQPFKLMCKISK